MNWYYALSDQRHGPVSDQELEALIAAGTINEDTLVWKEGLSGWLPLKQARPVGGAAPAEGNPPAGWIRCTATGRSYPPEEIVYIDGKPYSAAAKASVLQGVMQQGVLPSDGTERTGPPWENRAELGWFAAVWQTAKAVLLEPALTFENMKREGGVGSPLLYNVIVGSIGGIAGLVYQLVMNGGTMAFLPPEARHAAGNEMAVGIGMLIGGAIFMPLLLIIGSFVGAGLIHLSLMICSGAKQPFETTYRTYCYASGSGNLLQVVPVCGALVGWIWGLVSLCIGISRAHEITTGRAVLAVLLPSVVCCTGFIFIIMAVVGGVAASQGLQH